MSLVLTQNVGRDGCIHITNKETGEHMTIDVVDIQGRQARIAFNFPDNYSIQRDVIYQKDQKNVN